VHLCRQSEGDIVIDHDGDLEALAVRRDQALESSLGQDCRSSLVELVVDAFLENEELALGLDGTFRARYVAGAATSAPDSGGPQLVTRAQANPVGHYEERSDVDGVMRIVAYRKLADYPFIVTAAQSKNEALEDFYQRRNNYLSIAAAVSLVILVFFAVVTILAVRLQRHRSKLKIQRRFLEEPIVLGEHKPALSVQRVLLNETADASEDARFGHARREFRLLRQHGLET